jgi:nucleoporin POM152
MSSARPPPPPGPRIPPSIVDPPTQRLYLSALFALLQAYKLADAIQQQQATLPDDFNSLLLKWIAVDLAVVSLIKFLRVPRLDWGWKARWTARGALVALDWFLFGRWTVRPCPPSFFEILLTSSSEQFAVAFFLPSFLKNLLARALSTAESPVRLSSVYGKEKEHLGGQFTVHILAVSCVLFLISSTAPPHLFSPTVPLSSTPSRPSTAAIPPLLTSPTLPSSPSS